MKKVLSILLAAVLLLSLCACGQTEQKTLEGFKPALDTQKSADITVMGSYANFEALEAIFDDFNAYYPNVTLRYIKPDNYNNTIGMILDSDNAPNIYFTYNWMFDRERFEACFRHAEDLSDPSLGLDLSCIRQNLLSRDANGALPMIPVFSTTYGMLVNENLFKRENLAVPTTYPELLSVCEKLKENGYLSPLLGYMPDNPASIFAYELMYPYYCGLIADDTDAAAAANSMAPGAGEYMRPALEMVMDLIDKGYINLEECRKLEDGYTALILRFFEGDIPMMLCNGDTVSGTRKRESQSDAFKNSPFTYSFYTVPVTEEGGYLVDTTGFQFSINKDCNDLDMTNEFMRFLISSAELNKMAEIKRLVTPSTDLSYDDIYAPLANIPAERIVSPEKIKLTDDVTVQLRNAAFQVITGNLSIDEAVAQYGSIE